MSDVQFATDTEETAATTPDAAESAATDTVETTEATTAEATPKKHVPKQPEVPAGGFIDLTWAKTSWTTSYRRLKIEDFKTKDLYYDWQAEYFGRQAKAFSDRAEYFRANGGDPEVAGRKAGKSKLAAMTAKFESLIEALKAAGHDTDALVAEAVSITD